MKPKQVVRWKPDIRGGTRHRIRRMVLTHVQDKYWGLKSATGNDLLTTEPPEAWGYATRLEAKDYIVQYFKDSIREYRRDISVARKEIARCRKSLSNAKKL